MEVPGVVVTAPRKSAVVVELEGEHDLATSEQLRQLIRGLVEMNELVVIDVTNVLFVDSSVIKIFFEADRLARRDGKRLRLQVGTAFVIRRVLEISGALEALETASSREEALGSVHEHHQVPRQEEANS